MARCEHVSIWTFSGLRVQVSAEHCKCQRVRENKENRCNILVTFLLIYLYFSSPPPKDTEDVGSKALCCFEQAQKCVVT